MGTAGTQGKDTQQCARQGETKTVQVADFLEAQGQISSHWHMHERAPLKSGGKVGGSPPWTAETPESMAERYSTCSPCSDTSSPSRSSSSLTRSPMVISMTLRMM